MKPMRLIFIGFSVFSIATASFAQENNLPEEAKIGRAHV